MQFDDLSSMLYGSGFSDNTWSLPTPTAPTMAPPTGTPDAPMEGVGSFVPTFDQASVSPPGLSPALAPPPGSIAGPTGFDYGQIGYPAYGIGTMGFGQPAVQQQQQQPGIDWSSLSNWWAQQQQPAATPAPTLPTATSNGVAYTGAFDPNDKGAAAMGGLGQGF